MSGISGRIPATKEEVEVFASSLTPQYLYCRVWGHDAAPQTPLIAKNIEKYPKAYWDVLLLCTHDCGVRWRALVGGDGELLDRKLDYSEAPGYLCEFGRINRDGKMVLRKTFFVDATKRKRRKR